MYDTYNTFLATFLGATSTTSKRVYRSKLIFEADEASDETRGGGLDWPRLGLVNPHGLLRNSWVGTRTSR